MHPSITARRALTLLLALTLLAGGRAAPADATRAAGDLSLVGYFAHFAPTATYEQGVAAVDAAGLSIGFDVRAANAAYVFGREEQARQLLRSRHIDWLEAAATEPLLTGRAAWASRARSIYEPTSGVSSAPVADDEGRIVDGTGVGIAVVDTGIDATHPALGWAGSGDQDARVVRNFKVACTNPWVQDPNDPIAIKNGCWGPAVLQDVANSDTSSGHGTHVAGIAAAGNPDDGPLGPASTATSGQLRGVAPGARLYGFGAGEGTSIVVAHAVAALQWIYDHGHEQDPPIRVVNNSWGTARDYDPEAVVNKLATALVEDRGMVVVFAAGNDGGDGSAAATTEYLRSPTPGVIGVANYDHQEGTGRDRSLAAGSSRGLSTDPSTWPDISAPGTGVVAPCSSTGTCAPPVRGGAFEPTPLPPGYTSRTGTSMAAPHIAGIVALVLQARPDLTPAQVEALLESTAHPFTAGGPYVPDPAAPGSGATSFDKGHGLVDARAAVVSALGRHAEPPVDSGARDIATISDVEGDVALGALDLISASLTEQDGRIVATWNVRDVQDVGVSYNGVLAYGLAAAVPGGTLLVDIVWNGTTTSTTFSNVRPESVTVAEDTVTAVFTPSSLGLTPGGVITEVDAWTQLNTEGVDGRVRAERVRDATYDTTYGYAGS